MYVAHIAVVFRTDLFVSSEFDLSVFDERVVREMMVVIVMVA